MFRPYFVSLTAATKAHASGPRSDPGPRGEGVLSHDRHYRHRRGLVGDQSHFAGRHEDVANQSGRPRRRGYLAGPGDGRRLDALRGPGESYSDVIIRVDRGEGDALPAQSRAEVQPPASSLQLRRGPPKHEVAGRTIIKGEVAAAAIPLLSRVAMIMPFRPSLQRTGIEMVGDRSHPTHGNASQRAPRAAWRRSPMAISDVVTLERMALRPCCKRKRRIAKKLGEH